MTWTRNGIEEPMEGRLLSKKTLMHPRERVTCTDSRARDKENTFCSISESVVEKQADYGHENQMDSSLKTLGSTIEKLHSIALNSQAEWARGA